jgi:hypothetical protein
MLGALLFLLAAFCFLSGLGFAGLYCVPCNCTYDLRVPGCRTPIIYFIMTTIAVLGALGSLTNAGIRRRKSSLS